MLGFVQGDWSNGRLDSGLGQPGQSNKQSLLEAEISPEDGKLANYQADDKAWRVAVVLIQFIIYRMFVKSSHL